MATYLLQVNLYLIVFYGFYWVALRHETFHHLNRAYLVGTSILAFLIPTWQLAWVQNWLLTQEVGEQLYAYYQPMFIVQPNMPIVAFTWGQSFFALYLFGVAIAIGRLLLVLVHIKRFWGHSKHGAFAFFHLWQVADDAPHRDTLVAHEQTHVQQFHTADILWFEAIAIINWFNPVAYTYRQSIRNVHEFLADEVASQYENSRADYAMLLLSQQFGVKPTELIHTFFDKSTLKRRIVMLAKPKSKCQAIVKYGITAPICVGMALVSSAFVSKSKTISQVEQTIASTQPIMQSPLPISPNTLDISKALIVSNALVSKSDSNKKHILFP
jgi:BlaR1 peptidase M56